MYQIIFNDGIFFLVLQISKQFIHTNCEFGSVLQADYLNGLLILCYCFDKTMTRSMIMRGFTCCGQDCQADIDETTIDFTTMIYQFYTDIADERLMLMKEKTPVFVQLIKDHGRNCYQLFIDNRIKPGSTTIDRNSLSHIRHWSEIINHEEVTKRFHQDKHNNDPVVIANMKLKAREDKIYAASAKNKTK